MNYEEGKTYDITDLAEEQGYHDNYVAILITKTEGKVAIGRVMEGDYDGGIDFFTAEIRSVDDKGEDFNLEQIINILENDDLFCWQFDTFRTKEEAIDHIKEGKSVGVLDYLN